MSGLFQRFDYAKITNWRDVGDIYRYNTLRTVSWLAGGTDIVPELRIPGTGVCIAGKSEPMQGRLLVDINGFKPLTGISVNGGWLHLGALTTHSELVQNEQVRDICPALAQAARKIGSPQIRNVGTIGGNIGNAAPAADLLPPLIFADAEIEYINRVSGDFPEICSIPITQYLRNREEYRGKLISSVRIPINVGCWDAQAYLKQGKRAALAISQVGMAAGVCCKHIPEGVQIERICVVVGAMTNWPFRFDWEESLRVKNGTDCMSFCAMLAARIVGNMNKIHGERASRQFKGKVLCGMMYEFLNGAISEACI